MEPNPILFEVGGLCCSLQLNNQRYTDSFNDYFANFLTEASPDIHLEAELVKEPSLKEGFQARASNDISYIQVKKREVVVSDQFGEGHFYPALKKGKGVFYSYESFRNFVRISYALALLEKKAVIMHSSGVVHDNQATLFSGPSGAGKSTIMKLSGFPRLNEEANVLRLEKDRVMVQSTPFGGWEQHNTVKPLERIYFIEQSKKTFTQPMDAVEKFSQLMCNEFLSMSLIFNEAPQLVNEIFSLLNELLPKIEAERLFFEKNNQFLKLFT